MKFIYLLQNTIIFHNSLYAYAQALLLGVGVWLVLKLLESFIIARLKKLATKTKTDFDDVVIGVIHDIKPPLYTLAAFFAAVQMILLPDWVLTGVRVLFLLAIMYEIIGAVDALFVYGLKKYLATQDENGTGQNKSLITVLRIIVKTLLWSVALLFVLNNVGVNVTSLIASLGIGGIAIALAIQNVLGDLISSLSIYLDRPFEVGDFITVGQDSGTVKKIGIKTTRIKTLRGEELVISNRELTSVRVQNFKKLEKRREAFMLGVTYDTTQEQLEVIPSIIKHIIEAQAGVDFDRCHFSGFGDFALQFETVYHVQSSDYTAYMDTKQVINLAIFKAFAQERIEFAFPTQTIYLSKE